MELIILAVAILSWLVCFVCWILTLIPMFGNQMYGGVGKGLFGLICGLYAFIWGWQTADMLNRRLVMQIWTAGFVTSIVINVLSNVLYGGSGY